MVRLSVLACIVLVARVAAADDDPPTFDPDPVDAPAPAPAPAPIPAPVPAPAPAAAAPAAHDDETRLAAERSCAAHEPSCDWLRRFAPLERASLLRALAAKGYEIEAAPWGKTIAKIHVYNEDVFAEPNWLRFLNVFHYTTRPHAIRNELTIFEGQPWDDDLVAESARRLRDPLYSSVIALVPVRSETPGAVDLLVVTRDVWSLRLNSSYLYEQGTLTNLSISLSENNFLGFRDLASVAMTMDQGSIAVGPLFIDQNVLGKHIYLRVRVDEIVTRQALQVFDALPTSRTYTQHFGIPGDPHGLQDHGGLREEGHDASVTLQRPLWSLASEWGGGGAFSYSNSIVRTPYSTGLLGYDDPFTGNLLAREYRLKYWSATASVSRQWGKWLKQQLTFGHSVSSTKPSLLPSFPADAQLQADFAHDVLPRNETLSAPFVEYSFFMPRYEVVRNISTYELAEDLRIGPDLDAQVSQGLQLLGSSATYTRPSLSLGWTFPWCRGGFVRVAAGASLRLQSYTYPVGTPRAGQTVGSIDDTASASTRLATPMIGPVRIVAQASVNTRWNDSQNVLLFLGGDPGLRGYDLGVFSGERSVLAQVEVRSVPLPVWVLRTGAVAFYDVGGAATSFGQLALYNDVGVGVRLLIPQTSSALIRFDLAFPLQPSPDGVAAFSPHPIISYSSAF